MNSKLLRNSKILSKLFRVIFVALYLTVNYFAYALTYSPPQAEAQTGTYYSFDASEIFLNAFAYAAHGVPYTEPLPERSFPDYIDSYDLMAFTVSVQGLVNRNGPTFYVKHRESDQVLLDKLETQNLWPGNAQFTELTNIDQIINTFKSNSTIKGSVVWDDTKPYTFNIATTIAGVDGLVLVRKGSTHYQKITAAFPVKMDLTTQNFTSKGQAYRWMADQYIATGKTNKIKLAYLADGHFINLYKQNKAGYNNITVDSWSMMLRDVAISEKIAVVDLSPDARVRPLDYPNQAADEDYNTFKYVLDKQRAQAGSTEILRVMGFPNRKYISTDCDGNGQINEADYISCGEFSFSQLISQYGGTIKLGGGAVFDSEGANYSFLKYGKRSMVPLSSKTPPLTPQQLVAKGYVTGDPANPQSLQVNPSKKFVMFYMGDYDLLTGVTHSLVTSGHWEEKNSTTIPVAWGITRDVAEYTPTVYEYLAKTKGVNDYFVMPNSGFGYFNPSHVPAQYHPKVVQLSTFFNRSNGVSSGWVLDGNQGTDKILGSPTVGELYKKITPNGILYAGLTTSERRFDRTLAFSPMTNIDHAGKSEEVAAQELKNYVAGANQFYAFRTIFVSPGKETSVVNRAKTLGASFEVVDPTTYFYLIKLKGGSYPQGRFSVTTSTIPSSTTSGTKNLTMTVRNDGWDTWKFRQGNSSCNGSTTAGAGCVTFALYAGTEIPTVTGVDVQPTVNYVYRAGITKNVAPGETAQITFTNVEIPTPGAGGRVYLQVDVIKELEYFGERVGGTPWADYMIVTAGTTTGDPADINKDGAINSIDFVKLSTKYGQATCNLPGDINADCKVDGADVELMIGKWKPK